MILIIYSYPSYIIFTITLGRGVCTLYSVYPKGLVPSSENGMLISRSSVTPSNHNIDIKLSVNSPTKLNCQRPVVVHLQSIQKDKPSEAFLKDLACSWPIKYRGGGKNQRVVHIWLFSANQSHVVWPRARRIIHRGFYSELTLQITPCLHIFKTALSTCHYFFTIT